MQSPETSGASIVILAAGRGERFAIEGINVPKPLIEFRGRSLLAHTVELATHIAAIVQTKRQVIVVGTEPVALAATRIPGVDRVVEVSVVQPGPIASGMLALAHIEEGEAVVFLDCDNFYPGARDWVSKLPIGRAFLTIAGCPAGLDQADFLNVVVAPGLPPARILRLDEKIVTATPYVGTGVYGFPNARNFRWAAEAAARGNPLRKELPMSAAAAACLSLENGVTAIDASPWLPVGTPAQMMEAANASDDSIPF